MYGASGGDDLARRGGAAAAAHRVRRVEGAGRGGRSSGSPTTTSSPVSMRNATAYGVSPRLRLDVVLNNLVGWAHTTGAIRLLSATARPGGRSSTSRTSRASPSRCSRRRARSSAARPSTSARPSRTTSSATSPRVLARASPAARSSSRASASPDPRSLPRRLREARAALPDLASRVGRPARRRGARRGLPSRPLTSELFEGRATCACGSSGSFSTSGAARGGLRWHDRRSPVGRCGSRDPIRRGVRDRARADRGRARLLRTCCTRDEFAEQGSRPSSPRRTSRAQPARARCAGCTSRPRPHEEAKLVRCTRGAIFDVILDLRPDSATFLGWLGVGLDEDNGTRSTSRRGARTATRRSGRRPDVLYLMSSPYEPDARPACAGTTRRSGSSGPTPPERTMNERDRSWPDYVPPPDAAGA